MEVQTNGNVMIDTSLIGFKKMTVVYYLNSSTAGQFFTHKSNQFEVTVQCPTIVPKVPVKYSKSVANVTIPASTILATLYSKDEYAVTNSVAPDCVLQNVGLYIATNNVVSTTAFTAGWISINSTTFDVKMNNTVIGYAELGIKYQQFNALKSLISYTSSAFIVENFCPVVTNLTFKDIEKDLPVE